MPPDYDGTTIRVLHDGAGELECDVGIASNIIVSAHIAGRIPRGNL